MGVWEGIKEFFSTIGDRISNLFGGSSDGPSMPPSYGGMDGYYPSPFGQGASMRAMDQGGMTLAQNNAMMMNGFNNAATHGGRYTGNPEIDASIGYGDRRIGRAVDSVGQRVADAPGQLIDRIVHRGVGQLNIEMRRGIGGIFR